MDDKKAFEDFRVWQFSGPHPALQAAAAGLADHAALASTANGGTGQATAAANGAASDPLNINLVSDHQHVVVHFDVDCFYAQVEECRNPALRGQPLAVTQKYLVVTANYPARAAGVTKLMGIADAKKACPHLVLVPGEDLTPYRAASREIRAVLSRWGPTEKLGLDESWVDVTQEVNRRLSAAQASNTTSAISASAWCGHLVNSNLQLTSHSKHRPMDLRVVQQEGQQEQLQQGLSGSQQQQADQTDVSPAATASTPAVLGLEAVCVDGSAVAAVPPWLPACELRLKLGAVIAAEMRQAVKQEAGFRCSAGISCSKLLSKLVSGLHKPDDQTVILPTSAQAFVAPLPVRALPGVGYKAEGLLKSWGVSTAAEARAISKQQLVKGLGDKHGASLFYACRGVDPSPVVASGPPKSITVEDSFKACSSWQGVAQVLQVLVPDLIDRLQEDAQEFPQLQRTPSTLTVKWRKSGTGWARSSASTPWPAAAKVPPVQQAQLAPASILQHHLQHQQDGLGSTAAAGSASAIAALTAAATNLLKQHLPASGFSLTLLNIGATGFKGKPGPGLGGGIQQFLMPKQPSAQAVPVLGAGAAVAALAAAAAAPVLASTIHSPAQSAAAAGSWPAGAAGPVGGLAGGDLLQQARAATEARRDYNRANRSSSSELPWLPQHSNYLNHTQQQQQQHTANRLNSAQQHNQGTVGGGQVMMTKRQERRLWELAMQRQQQHQQQQGQLTQPLAPSPTSCMQPPTHQQQQGSGKVQAPAVHSPPFQQQSQQQMPCSSPSQHASTDTQALQGCGDERLLKRQCLVRNGDSPATAADTHMAQVSHNAAETSAPAAMSAAFAGRSAAAAVLHKSERAQPVQVVLTATGNAVNSAMAIDAASGAGCSYSAEQDVGGQGAAWQCTNLHSVEGWGLVVCEVLEDFDDGEDQQEFSL